MLGMILKSVSFQYTIETQYLDEGKIGKCKILTYTFSETRLKCEIKRKIS
jgi:hypothetical protein